MVPYNIKKMDGSFSNFSDVSYNSPAHIQLAKCAASLTAEWVPSGALQTYWRRLKPLRTRRGSRVSLAKLGLVSINRKNVHRGFKPHGAKSIRIMRARLNRHLRVDDEANDDVREKGGETRETLLSRLRRNGPFDPSVRPWEPMIIPGSVWDPDGRHVPRTPKKLRVFSSPSVVES